MVVTGAFLDNPPGLPAIDYRAVRYGRVRADMLRGIGTEARYLRDLNTRDPADPSIALIDCWAVAGDVLNFYAERIANENWLRTATERRSVRALVRLIDYELKPGKAAEALLAFTLETAPGAPFEVPLPAGQRVNSIPGPGETMFAFEAVEAIVGRGDLNAMRPRRDRVQTLDDVAAGKTVLAVGLLTPVRRGDWLLLARGVTPTLQRVERVTSSPPDSTTRIDFVAAVVSTMVSPPVTAWSAPMPCCAADRRDSRPSS